MLRARKHRLCAELPPAAGLLKTLPNLKAVFSLGAGVDGFLCDPDYPKQRAAGALRRRDAVGGDGAVRPHACADPSPPSAPVRRRRSASANGARWCCRAAPRTRASASWALARSAAVTARRLRRARLSRLGLEPHAQELFPGVKSFAGDGELEAFLASDGYSGLPAVADAQDRRHSQRQDLRGDAQGRLRHQCGARRTSDRSRSDRGARQRAICPARCSTSSRPSRCRRTARCGAIPRSR